MRERSRHVVAMVSSVMISNLATMAMRRATVAQHLIANTARGHAGVSAGLHSRTGNACTVVTVI